MVDMVIELQWLKIMCMSFLAAKAITLNLC